VLRALDVKWAAGRETVSRLGQGRVAVEQSMVFPSELVARTSVPADGMARVAAVAVAAVVPMVAEAEVEVYDPAVWVSGTAVAGAGAGAASVVPAPAPLVSLAECSRSAPIHPKKCFPPRSIARFADSALP
jgi:hypothetical protein